jgi:Kef-type K+ transport system membrane component KefB
MTPHFGFRRIVRYARWFTRRDLFEPSARWVTFAVVVATAVFTFAYVAAMLFGVRPFLARLAARVTTPGAMSQNMVALVLLLMLVSSWVTERIGIHVLFGAFLFGVVLPKEGGFARALAEKLEDVVVVILLPLFFAVSGLRTEIAELGTPDHLAICGLIIAVASVGKFGGGAIAARLTGMSWREAGAIGVLMNTRGLMELIVLNIALDLGVITPALFSMMVVMARRERGGDGSTENILNNSSR